MIRDELLAALILFSAIFGLIFTGCLSEPPTLVEVEERSLDLQTCNPACQAGYQCNQVTKTCEPITTPCQGATCNDDGLTPKERCRRQHTYLQKNYECTDEGLVELTDKQVCEKDHPGKTCDENGNVVENDHPDEVNEENREDENLTAQSPLTDSTAEDPIEGTSEINQNSARAQQTETTQLSADTSILTYLPKGVRVLTTADRTSLRAHNCSAAASNTQITPQSGILPHESKGGPPSMPTPGPAPHESKGGSGDVPQYHPAGSRNLQNPTPGPTPFESTGGATDVTQATTTPTTGSCTTKAPENLCIGEAYSRVKLSAAGEDPNELAETFELVQFSTSAYLTFKLDHNQNMIVNSKDIRTLIGGTLLKLNNNLIVRGLDSTGKAALIYQGDGLVSKLRLHPENSQIMMLQHSTESFDPPIINLGVVIRAAITLFALTPTSEASDPLVRHVPKKNMMKLNLSPFHQCIGLYQNTAKTKFPVVLVSQVKTGE